MNVILAVVGSRGLGQPVMLDEEIYPGAQLNPSYTNTAQFNFAFRELNETVKRITVLEKEINPEFNPSKHIDVIVGDAIGADDIGRIWARVNQLNCTVIAAKWRAYGKSAGHRRNPDIINPAKYVVAFWDGISAGTEGSINIAKTKEKKLKIIKYLKHVPNLKRQKT